MPRFVPESQFRSPRFAGVRTFMRLPHLRTVEDVDFAVLGVPLDAATMFRSGARFGPEGIRAMSVMIRGFNPELDVDVFERLSGVDYGDCPIIPGYVEDSYRIIQNELKPIVAAGVVPVVLGGDHSVTLPELRVVAAEQGPVALVHFDAHLDTRQDHLGKLYGHGTPFRRAAEEGLVEPERSIQIGMRGSLPDRRDVRSSLDLGYQVVTTSQAREMGAQRLGAAIRERVGDRPAFLTFDVDVVDPAFAPGTGTPTVAGLSSNEALEMIRALSGIRFVAMDVVEVAPEYDVAGITSLLAATAAWEFLSLLAIGTPIG